MLYISGYTGKEIDNALLNGGAIGTYNGIRLLAGLQYSGYTTTETTDDEWAYLLTDNVDKILAGVRQDGSLYVADL